MPTSLRDASSSDTSIPSPESVRMGLVGLGGYARGLIDVIRSGSPATELRAGCDPDLRLNAEAADELRDAGSVVFPSFDAMLEAHTNSETRLDAAWLPVPIHLHRPFVERCLDAGLAVMVEKPAAGCVQDVDAMIAARDRAQRPVLVGFQDLYFEENHEAKRRLLDSAIGTVRRVGIAACWPRSDAYYGRNGWAGALRHADTWVLDSPLNNALAHPVHLALFMLGPSPGTPAMPRRVEAELYRANPIESFDTCTVRVTTDTGVEVTIAFTHACAERHGPVTMYFGDHGTMRCTHTEIRLRSETAEGWGTQINRDMASLPRRFAAAVLGDDASHHPAATLDTARLHSSVVSAAMQHTPIRSVHTEHIRVVRSADERTLTVEGIEDALRTCADEGRLLSELSGARADFPWLNDGGKTDEIGTPFTGVASD